MRAMRSIRSARVAAFIGRAAPSFRIIRSRSCSCTTTTSLASINSCLQKVIVNMIFRVGVRGDQSSKRQKRFLTQMRLVGDLYFSALSRQHPRRNLQTLSGRVNDADRSIAPLGPADDLQGSPVKWVKAIEDLNIRIIGAPGIVGVGVFIPICIVSCLVVASPWTAAVGWPAVWGSSCP